MFPFISRLGLTACVSAFAPVSIATGSIVFKTVEEKDSCGSDTLWQLLWRIVLLFPALISSISALQKLSLLLSVRSGRGGGAMNFIIIANPSLSSSWVERNATKPIKVLVKVGHP